MAESVWLQQISENGEVFTLIQTDISPVELMSIYWHEKFRWNHRFIANIENAALFAGKDLLMYIREIRRRSLREDVSFAMYELKKGNEKSLIQECCNCAKYYQHYVKSEFYFTPTLSGHCFPKSNGDPLHRGAHDLPQRKNCFEWKDELKERVAQITTPMTLQASTGIPPRRRV